MATTASLLFAILCVPIFRIFSLYTEFKRLKLFTFKKQQIFVNFEPFFPSVTLCQMSVSDFGHKLIPQNTNFGVLC